MGYCRVGFISTCRMRYFMAFERAWNLVLKQSALEVRDRALSVLADMGLSWDENPLRPQHDQPVHADGRNLSDDEYEKLMQNDAFNEAVWDLTNVWALSDERRKKVLEYARQQMIGGFNDG